MSSGEITGVHFQSLEYLVRKCGTFSDLVAQLSVSNFSGVLRPVNHYGYIRAKQVSVLNS